VRLHASLLRETHVLATMGMSMSLLACLRTNGSTLLIFGIPLASLHVSGMIIRCKCGHVDVNAEHGYDAAMHGGMWIVSIPIPNLQMHNDACYRYIMYLTYLMSDVVSGVLESIE
jgi:hypothetical protein